MSQERIYISGVRSASTQNIPSGAATYITFDTPQYTHIPGGPTPVYPTNFFQVGPSGLYEISSTMAITSGTLLLSTVWYSGWIDINGGGVPPTNTVRYGQNIVAVASPNNFTCFGVNAKVELAAGSTVHFVIQHNASSAQSINGTSTNPQTSYMIQYVSEIGS